MRCLPWFLPSPAPRIVGRVQYCRSSFSLAPLVRQRSWNSTAVRSRAQRVSRLVPPAQILESSSGALGLVAAASVAIGAAFYYHAFYEPPSTTPGEEAAQSLVEKGGFVSEDTGSNISEDSIDQMATQLPPGRVGNLTPEQEEKLRELWTAIFRVCNVDISATEPTDAADAADAADEEDGVAAAPVESNSVAVNGDGKKKEKKKKRNIFKRSKKDAGATDDSASAASKSASAVNVSAADDDKYGQGKVFQDALASQPPESIRATIWSMVKHDHPDALVLRFLRARKWDVDKALVMLVSTMHWRSQDMHVDDDIMQKGEGGAAEEIKITADAKAKTISEDFLAQMRMGKSFLHGVDKAGRPICVVRVRLHHQGDQVEEAVERCTVYIIETARMALHPPVDTATIIFDMTGFSLANMDYSPVKFMIKCFEANYPECLGTVLVHKAPWLFQGIWKIIRGWLDPVVASKVHFTNNVKDMEQFINKEQIIKELDGDEDWEYRYVEPEPGENDKMNDTATRDKLLAERETLYRDYEAATAEWILNPDGEQGKAVKAKRDDIATKLREDYWRLDPYVRARSLYDRIGMLEPGGTVNFYPKIKKDEITQTNGNAVAQTSADDVD